MIGGMKTAMSVDERMALLGRGVEAVYTEEDLRRKLTSERPLRIKLGMDPTAPDIHLGHAVVLRKMRQFQDLGHKAVLIIGDYTARIGDPTGVDRTRPVLSEAEITRNAQTYLEQAGQILDTAPEKLELRRNSEWLEGLSFADVLRLSGQFTVQQMLHRESFRKRMQAGRQIAVSEFMYPLMQAYDSVAIEADVELGGTDQTFNNLRGRDLMGRHGLEPQVVVVMPILAGLDGHEKMSKSKGNYVAVGDEPGEMFGKLMSIPDDAMPHYLRLLTPLPEPRIASLVNPEETHPRRAKDTLARTVVEGFYDVGAANRASEAFRRRFAEGELPEDMEVKEVAGSAGGVGGERPLAEVIAEVGFASSKSEARRLIKQGAVSFDGEKIDDPAADVSVPSDRAVVLKVGKRRVCRVREG